MILTRSTRLSQPADAAGVDSRFGGRNDWLIAPGSPGSLPISGVVPTIPDQYGRSHYFDGATTQLLGNAADVNATGGQFTLLAYAKFDNTTSDHGVVGNRATTGANAYAQIVHRAAGLQRRIIFVYKGTSASAEVAILSAAQSVPGGSTQLVAMVVNGTSVRCYIGSELVGSGVSAAPEPSGHIPYLRAGNYYDNATARRFIGGIYYAGLLPVALSGEDIGALARNPWQLFRPVQRRVYFDMGAGGGTSPVSSDQSASYAIRGEVSSDQSAAYAIRSSVSADLSASYNIQTASAVSSDLSSGYEIRTSAQSDVSAEYAIRASVQADSSAAYAIRSSVQADAGAAYIVRGAVFSDASASYVVRTNASADLSAAYEIQTASGVGASLDASYNVRAAVQSDASAAYDLRTAVGATSEHAFMVRGLVSSDLDASFTVEAPITQVYADLQAAYLVDGGTVFIPSQFVASVPAGVFSARAPAGEYSATVPSGNYRPST